jgi:hypothetical protein
VQVVVVVPEMAALDLLLWSFKVERIAIIENDQVINVVMAPIDWSDPNGLECVLAPFGANIEIGSKRQADGNWLMPAEPLTRSGVKVYRRAFRLALQQTPYGDANLLVAIEAHVATLDPYDSIRMAWEDVTIFERNHPDMSMFLALGLTDEQIDDIFRLAQSIEAGA